MSNEYKLRNSIVSSFQKTAAYSLAIAGTVIGGYGYTELYYEQTDDFKGPSYEASINELEKNYQELRALSGYMEDKPDFVDYRTLVPAEEDNDKDRTAIYKKIINQIYLDGNISESDALEYARNIVDNDLDILNMITEDELRRGTQTFHGAHAHLRECRADISSETSDKVRVNEVISCMSDRDYSESMHGSGALGTLGTMGFSIAGLISGMFYGVSVSRSKRLEQWGKGNVKLFPPKPHKPNH